MTDRRLSKRTSSVTKRRLLEDKIEQRKELTEVRKQKARSKLLKKLRTQELNLFTEEALRLSDIAERFELNQDSETGDQTHESLEWDNSEDSAPSFLTATSLADHTVDEIIQEILSPDSPTTEGSFDFDLLNPGQQRRKTSTDPQFLDGIGPVVSRYNTFGNFNWPPKSPSAEPDVFSPGLASSINQDFELENLGDILETEPATTGSIMDEETFKERLKAVKIAEKKVKGDIKLFLAVNLKEVDVVNYGDRLEKIRSKLELFNELAIALICDLDEGNTDDQARVANLEKQQDDLLQEVVTNEMEVKEKIKTLMDSQPMSEADKESLELKKKKMSMEEEEKNNARAEKAKRISIDIEDISARATSLHKLILGIDKAKDLSDQDVRQYLLDSKRWESKLEDIVSSKVKVDKDVVGSEVDPGSIKKLTEVVSKVKEAVADKIADLKRVDKERCLFSLSKAVKEVAVYPPVFGGTDGEDVYKFKEKLVEAITANQVREKDKIDILRKYLKGKAKKMIGEHYETFDKALEALLSHFGLAKKTWENKLKEFVKDCQKPLHWLAYGTNDRLTVIGSTCQFLREAEKLAKDHDDLKNTIISHTTIDEIFKVIPQAMVEKVLELGTGPGTKEEVKFKNIKTILDKQHQLAIESTLHEEALKDNSTKLNAVLHNAEGPKK